MGYIWLMGERHRVPKWGRPREITLSRELFTERVAKRLRGPIRGKTHETIRDRDGKGEKCLPTNQQQANYVTRDQ